MTDTINNGLPFVPENTIDPAAGLNLALNKLDAILNIGVITAFENDPPGLPSEGDRHIVGSTPTGAWAGHADEIARYLDGAWHFYEPTDGTVALRIDESLLLTYDGGWSSGINLDSAALISQITKAISGIQIIDMDGDDYNVPEPEAGASMYFVINAATGKTVTFNDSHYYPSFVSVISLSAFEFFVSFASEQITVKPSEIKSIVLSSDLGVIADSLRGYASARGNVLVFDFDSDESKTIAADESSFHFLELTDTGAVLTGAVAFIIPVGFPVGRFIAKNSTAQTIAVKTANLLPGIAIPATEIKDLYFNGVDIAEAP